MTNIFCTKKLEKLVGKKLIASQPVSDELLGNWNANLFPMNGRKCLIVMNDVTFYCLIFLDILKKDILNFHELFYQRLIEQLDYDQVNFSVEFAPKLMTSCEPNFLRTNNNRKVLGTMNEFVYELEYHFQMDYYGNFAQTNIVELNHRLTDNLVGALKQGQSNFGRPIEEMKELLEKACS
jgi:hypothetical protein